MTEMRQMRLDPGGKAQWVLEQLERGELSRDEFLLLAEREYDSKVRKIPRVIGLLQHVRMVGYNGFQRLYHIMPDGVAALARLRAWEAVLVEVSALTVPERQPPPETTSVRIFARAT